jgi:hypothetical protein
MESLPIESVIAVRQALSVAQTSLYLLRGRLDAAGVHDPYLDKHVSRIEGSVGRAAVALRDAADGLA